MTGAKSRTAVACIVILAVTAGLAMPMARAAGNDPSVVGGTTAPQGARFPQTTTGQSSMVDNLGPAIPMPGQPSPISWQDRLGWLQQQLRVLGHDPGPNQDLFRRLSQQVDAIVAAMPAVSGPQGAVIPTQGPISPAGQAIGAGGSAGSAQVTAVTPSATGVAPGAAPGMTPAVPGGAQGIVPTTEGGAAGGSTAAPAAAGPVAQPGPLAGAAHEVFRIFQMTREMERSVANPLEATILAVYGIVDAAKENPQQAVNALQSLLEKEQSVAGRTVIYFGLKDVLLKAGQRDQAIQQLQSIVQENDRLLTNGPRWPGGPPASMQSGRPPAHQPGIPPALPPEMRGRPHPGEPRSSGQ